MRASEEGEVVLVRYQVMEAMEVLAAVEEEMEEAQILAVELEMGPPEEGGLV